MWELNIPEKLRKKIKSFHKNHKKKLYEIFISIGKDPCVGIAKPKRLRKYVSSNINLDNCYSRKVDKKNRIVYQVIENEKKVIILSVKGHYKDK